MDNIGERVSAARFDQDVRQLIEHDVLLRSLIEDVAGLRQDLKALVVQIAGMRPPLKDVIQAGTAIASIMLVLIGGFSAIAIFRPMAELERRITFNESAVRNQHILQSEIDHVKEVQSDILKRLGRAEEHFLRESEHEKHGAEASSKPK